MKRLLSALAMAGLVMAASRSQATDPAILAERNETQAQRDARMEWFREARFGMFVHWGLYAQAAGEWNGKPVGGIGEWIMNRARIPIADYAAMAPHFNPVKFDAEKWVLAAKGAGMKYIVITSKHHEGFAMFKTAASPFNIVDATPYKHDPLKDLAEACRKHGMKLGFYYSQNLDWHHPGGGGNNWDKAHEGDSDQYVDKIVIPQVREILSNYGDIAVIWWDIPGGVINKARADRIHKVVMELRPKIIMNNRLGGGYRGDTETPEQHIPATGYPGRDWETCMTMNDTWGFKKNDHNWKSVSSIIHMLCDIASKGGNYLLNVGPTAEGEIPQASLDRMAAVGLWMKVNGDAIYGTSASPFPKGVSWGRVTQNDNLLYLMVFDLPSDRTLVLPGLTTKVKKAWFLDRANRKSKLVVANDEAGVKVTVPEGVKMSGLATVVVLKLVGKPEVIPVSNSVKQAPDGTLVLKAGDAGLVGHVKLEDDHIGFWTEVGDTVSWTAEITAPGTFSVTLDYGCIDGSEGSEFDVTMGDSKVSGKIAATGGWSKFTEVTLGSVTITKAGKVAVVVKPTKKPGQAVMNLRAIKLVPVSGR
jgi:alpha-L-fucosidase